MISLVLVSKDMTYKMSLSRLDTTKNSWLSWVYFSVRHYLQQDSRSGDGCSNLKDTSLYWLYDYNYAQKLITANIVQKYGFCHGHKTNFAVNASDFTGKVAYIPVAIN